MERLFCYRHYSKNNKEMGMHDPWLPGGLRKLAKGNKYLNKVHHSVTGIVVEICLGFSGVTKDGVIDQIRE